MLCSIYEWSLPCPNLLASLQGISQRSQRLQAWLGRHSQQLSGLRCDLPANIYQRRCLWERGLEGWAASLRAVLPAMEEALWQHRTALFSALLRTDKVEATAGDGSLAGCTALESLTVWRFLGAAEVLAAAVAPLPSLTSLELAWGASTPGQLLCAAPPFPLPSVLKAMLLCRKRLLPYNSDDSHRWDVAGLAACSGLTRLDAAFGVAAANAAFNRNLAQLR